MNDDRNAILGNFSDDTAMCWFFDQPFTELKQAEELISEFNQHFVEDTGITWAITFKENQDVIGAYGLELYQKGERGDIGFDLAQAH